MTDEPGGSSAWRRAWPEAALIATHVALLLRVLRPHVLLGTEPVRSTDHALHWYRAQAVGSHFVPHGRLWGYDPYHVSGAVTGTVHDLDNKGVELFVGLFGPLVGDGVAFNWFLFLCYGAVPLAILVAARALRLPRAAAWCAAAVSVAAFHGDPYVASWTLFGGFGFVHASVVAPTVVAILARRVESPSARSAWWLLATAPLFYVHVLAAVIAAVLGLALVPRALRAPPRTALVTLAVVAAIVVVNLPWIAPMLGDWGRISPTPAANVRHGVPFAGLAELVADGRVLGVVLPLVAGAAGICLTWRSGRRSLAIAWAVGGVALVIGAFEGSRSLLVRSLVEPARLKVTIPFALALPTGVALHAAWTRVRNRFGVRGAVIAVGVALLASAPWTARPLATRALGSAHLRADLDPRVDELFERMRDLGDPRGRLALEEIGPFDGGGPPFRAYLAAIAPLHTGRPMVGGPYYRGFTPEKVAAFVNGKLGGRPLAMMSDHDVLGWFERYDVTGVVACQEATIARLRRAQGVVEEHGSVSPYVLFRVLRDSVPTLLGDAHVAIDYDRIDVAPGGDEPVVVKWHFDRRLTVPEPLRISCEPVPDGDPGFIRVEGHGGEPFAITVR